MRYLHRTPTPASLNLPQINYIWLQPWTLGTFLFWANRYLPFLDVSLGMHGASTPLSLHPALIHALPLLFQFPALPSLSPIRLPHRPGCASYFSAHTYLHPAADRHAHSTQACDKLYRVILCTPPPSPFPCLLTPLVHLLIPPKKSRVRRIGAVRRRGYAPSSLHPLSAQWFLTSS